MRVFNSLTHAGQLRRLRRLATLALTRYDLRVKRMTALEYRTNAVFGIRDELGRRFVLRIHPPGRYSLAEIRSELLWLAALRNEGFLVPDPVMTRDGNCLISATVTGVPEARACVLFGWVPGRFLREQELTTVHLAAVGSFTARLHSQAERFALPAGFSRPPWDWQRAFGTSSILGTGRGAALLSSEDRAVVSAAALQVRDAMAQLGSASNVFGLIHSDLHEANYLFNRDAVGAVDFEDCGQGYVPFEMAVTLFEVHSRPDYDALQHAYLEGYARVRALPPDVERHIRRFTAMRIVELINWASASENPKLQEEFVRWLPRGRSLLRRYVE